MNNLKISAKKKFGLLQKLSKTSKNNIIPPLLDNGELVNDSLQQAEMFNKYFTGKSNVRNPNDKTQTFETTYHLGKARRKWVCEHWRVQAKMAT